MPSQKSENAQECVQTISSFLQVEVLREIAGIFGLYLLFISVELSAQTEAHLHGRIVNSTNQALAYASVYVLKNGEGVISNEDGYFSIKTDGLSAQDSVRFQYLGYAEQKLSLGELMETPIVRMQARITTLGELLVYGDPPKAEDIVKMVLKKRKENYPGLSSKAEVFIRERYTQEISKLSLDHKKSSVKEVDEKVIETLEQHIPRNSTWYTDFLGAAYEQYEDDELQLKLVPKKVVSLKQEDLKELEYIEEIFKDLAVNTSQEEYWKIKTGILSQKIDLELDSTPEDLREEDNRKMKYYRPAIRSHISFADMEDDDEWEFLHSTRKYDFTLLGGSRLGGESVYIIDFTPRRSGLFAGRLFIGVENYALLRADYSYADGRLGTDVHLFGVGYTKNGFDVSVTFEKVEDGYALKYLSKRSAYLIRLDRKFSLIKKRERFLFDKELHEIKTGLVLDLYENNSVELLVLNRSQISPSEYKAVQEVESMKVIYVDQFREDLWKGYSIIEPTKAMKEYMRR